MRFVQKMFRDRHYRAEVKTTYDPDQNQCQMVTVTDTGENVVAIFADHKNESELENIEIEVQPSLIVPLKSQKKKTGTDYIKSIVLFAKQHEYKVVILVSDIITPQASALMMKTEGFRMTHFTYEQTGIEHMADHITQPMQFQALVGKKREEFIKKNPLYKTELVRYSFCDTLVKYHGMVIGDIIYILDNDRQSGIVEEFGIVVEEIT